MKKVRNLGEVYMNGEIINLNTTPIEILESKAQEIEFEEKNIKNQIFNILESL